MLSMQWVGEWSNIPSGACIQGLVAGNEMDAVVWLPCRFIAACINPTSTSFLLRSMALCCALNRYSSMMVSYSRARQDARACSAQATSHCARATSSMSSASIPLPWLSDDDWVELIQVRSYYILWSWHTRRLGSLNILQATIFLCPLGVLRTIEWIRII